jgi:MoaD family protein
VTLKIKFIGALRHISGKTQLTMNFHAGITVKDVVEQLGLKIPALQHTFFGQELNDARSNSLILIGGKEISVLDGYETQLCDGDEVVFVPVVHGG